jgi:hypothetical protein
MKAWTLLDAAANEEDALVAVVQQQFEAGVI